MSDQNLGDGKRLSNDCHFRAAPVTHSTIPSLGNRPPGFLCGLQSRRENKSKSPPGFRFFSDGDQAGPRQREPAGQSSDVSPQPLPALPALPSSCGLQAAQPGEAAGSSPAPGHRPAEGTLLLGAAVQNARLPVEQGKKLEERLTGN